MSGMSDRLRALIEKARGVVMSPEQRRAQEIDFAYGNATLADPRVTREVVASPEVEALLEDHWAEHEPAYRLLAESEQRDRDAETRARLEAVREATEVDEKRLTGHLERRRQARRRGGS